MAARLYGTNNPQCDTGALDSAPFFIYPHFILGCAGSLLPHGPFSGCAERGPLCHRVQLLTAQASLVEEWSQRRLGLQQGQRVAQELRLPGSRAQTPWLWPTG